MICAELESGGSIDELKPWNTCKTINYLAALIWRSQHYYPSEILYFVSCKVIPDKNTPHGVGDEMDALIR